MAWQISVLSANGSYLEKLTELRKSLINILTKWHIKTYNCGILGSTPNGDEWIPDRQTWLSNYESNLHNHQKDEKHQFYEAVRYEGQGQIH
jgi:hypothetical protein